MASTQSPLVYGSLTAVLITFGLAFAQGCTGLVTQAEVLAGSCEGSPYEKDMSADTGDTGSASFETTFEVSVDGGDVVIAIEDLDAITITGDVILVDFADVTADEACGCMCVMDFEIRVPAVAPGDYTIDLDYNGQDLTLLEVTVP
jgi:hypothetical protein